jgi:hypothetical protein
VVSVRRSLFSAFVLVAAGLVLLAPAAVGAKTSAPSLAWSPTTSAGTFDYGTVTVGDTPSQAFTLKNSGGVGSSALAVSLTGSSAFTVTANACTAVSLGPKKTCGVTVQYSPSAAGATDTATLTATSKKPAASTSITLKGAGAATGHLYWATDNGMRDGGTIVEANLDGSNQQTIVSGLNAPRGVVVDGSHLYWANFALFTISEANLDGSNPHTIVSGQDPVGMAIDANHLYWANGFGTIAGANLDGSNPQTIASGQNGPLFLAVDANHLYWTNFTGGTVVEANLDGSNPQTIASGQNGAGGVAVSP